MSFAVETISDMTFTEVNWAHIGIFVVFIVFQSVPVTEHCISSRDRPIYRFTDIFPDI